MKRKGIVLAGGTGSRLFPITMGVSKQLLPVYDKPMVYYPLSVLLLGGVRDIAIVTTREDQAQFQRLLGNGEQWGISLSYLVQPKPEGIAQVFLICEEFLSGAPSTLILGDNLIYGHSLSDRLLSADSRGEGATVFAHPVSDPRPYGVVVVDEAGHATSIVEKPKDPPSNLAVTGLYVYDKHAVDYAKALKPSHRGELEITDLNRCYLDQGKLHVDILGRGFVWLDTGNPGDLLKAGQFVEVLQERQGLMVACLEEIAFNQGFLGRDELAGAARRYQKSPYGAYLMKLLEMAR